LLMNPPFFDEYGLPDYAKARMAGSIAWRP